MSLQQQLYDALLDHVSPGEGSFLIHKTNDIWDWKRDDAKINPAAYSLVGFMPAPPTSEGPFYMPGASSIYQAYRSVISSVKLEVSDEQKQQLMSLEESMAAVQAKKNENYKTYLYEYNSDGKPADEDEYRKMTGWDVKIKMYDDELKELLRKKDEILKRSNVDHYDVVAALDKEKGFTGMFKSGKVSNVPNYIIDKQAIEWRDKVSNGQGNTVTIQLSSRDRHESRTKETFSAGVRFFFFFSIGGGSSSRETVNIEEEETNITIKFDAINTVNVRPDPEWYNQPYLNKIGQLNQWLDRRSTEQIFGLPGGFHSVVTGFVVVYQPSVEISTSASCREQMKSAIKGGGGFGFGPFFFGGGGSRKEERYDLSEKDGKLVLKSQSKYGQIIGVLVNNPNKM